MKRTYSAFLTSIKAQMSPDAMSLRRFLTEETYLNGKLFSFKHHEFQEYVCKIVENNVGKTISVAKCSQIGLSEIFNRIALARMAVRPGTSVLVSFPSKSFSQEVLKTRFASIIRDSPTLKALINTNVDSASVKEFLNGSIMYALGGSAQSSTTLLNRPIDFCLIDEKDRQDQDIVSGYRSRMTHTPPEERLIINISTPTVEGVGIDAEIQDSYEVHTPWVMCHECKHEFIADFYENVVVPGYVGLLQQMTTAIASTLNLETAYLECPDCKSAITEGTKDTVWKVTYNEEGNKKKIGITIDPFAAMGFITIPDLVEASLEYTSHVEFLNQGLGKTASKSDTSINISAIKFTNQVHPITGNPKGSNVFGLDLGKLCHFMHGILKSDSTIHIVHTEIVPLPALEEFLAEQHRKYTFAAGVMDSQPYSDLVYKLVRRYPRLFSAIYVSPTIPIPEMYRLKMIDKHNEIVRQVAINKSVTMDSFAGSLLDFFTFESSPLDATITKHFTDMRRVRDYRFSEMIYKWTKSAKGEDHFFHTAIYLFMATKLALAGLNTSAAIPLVINKINPNRIRANKRR